MTINSTRFELPAANGTLSDVLKTMSINRNLCKAVVESVSSNFANETGETRELCFQLLSSRHGDCAWLVWCWISKALGVAPVPHCSYTNIAIYNADRTGWPDSICDDSGARCRWRRQSSTYLWRSHCE